MTVTVGNLDCGAQKVMTVGYLHTAADYYSANWLIVEAGVYRPVIKLRTDGSYGRAKAYLRKYVDGGSDIDLAVTTQIEGSGTDLVTGTDVTLASGDKVYIFLDVIRTYSGDPPGAKAKAALGISVASAVKSNIDRQDAQTGDLMGGSHVSDMFV